MGISIRSLTESDTTQLLSENQFLYKKNLHKIHPTDPFHSRVDELETPFFV